MHHEQGICGPLSQSESMCSRGFGETYICNGYVEMWHSDPNLGIGLEDAADSDWTASSEKNSYSHCYLSFIDLVQV
jgi:hypothetical protein